MKEQLKGQLLELMEAFYRGYWAQAEESNSVAPPGVEKRMNSAITAVSQAGFRIIGPNLTDDMLNAAYESSYYSGDDGELDALFNAMANAGDLAKEWK